MHLVVRLDLGQIGTDQNRRVVPAELAWLVIVEDATDQHGHSCLIDPPVQVLGDCFLAIEPILDRELGGDRADLPFERAHCDRGVDGDVAVGISCFRPDDQIGRFSVSDRALDQAPLTKSTILGPDRPCHLSPCSILDCKSASFGPSRNAAVETRTAP